jgi:hypothetical protein
MSIYYNAFGPYIRNKFKENVYKVNIDAGFTCPNRDGSVGFGGCTYCNNDSFRPTSVSPSLTITKQIENGISYLTKRYGAKKFIAYFQPYTNTYSTLDVLDRLYSEALMHPQIIGLAIGTRPDSVDHQKIELLSTMAREYFVLIEYGLQSIYDKTLSDINRGHDFKCFVDALNLTANKGIHIGTHIIAGFPTEDMQQTISMAGVISTLPIEFLKIHQLQIIKETKMADMYRETPFPLFSYDQYLDFLVNFIERLSPNIVLQRLFATAPDNILIAPLWDRQRQNIIRDIDERFKKYATFQGRLYEGA